MRIDFKTIGHKPIVQQVVEHDGRRIGAIKISQQMQIFTTESTIVVQTIGNRAIHSSVGLRVGERCVNVNNVHGHSDWRGDIDEAMLFNTAITAEEVDYIYNLRYRSKTASAPALRLPGTPNAAAFSVE